VTPVSPICSSTDGVTEAAWRSARTLKPIRAEIVSPETEPSADRWSSCSARRTLASRWEGGVGDPDRALVDDRVGERAADRSGGVRGEPSAATVVELLNGAEQADRALLYEILVPTAAMAAYGPCAAGRSRAHARSGDRIAIAAYLGAGTVFDEALPTFAEAYADQNERDYTALAEAVKSGDIAALPGL
jgi:Uncharacterized protein conserved in bacteria (DUF2252)